jgi:hypothetical protein
VRGVASIEEKHKNCHYNLQTSIGADVVPRPCSDYQEVAEKFASPAKYSIDELSNAIEVFLDKSRFALQNVARSRLEDASCRADLECCCVVREREEPPNTGVSQTTFWEGREGVAIFAARRAGGVRERQRGATYESEPDQ